MMRNVKYAIYLMMVLTFISGNVYGQSIVNTVHNLSVSGPGEVKAGGESEICVFCHIPHTSSPRKPLWSRPDPGVTYTLYNSSTIEAVPGQPTGASILCLSCHDGTIALGNVLNRDNPITFGGGVTTMPAGPSNLSTNLADDHPISFLYSTTLAIMDGNLVDPSALTGPVQLENDQMQCTSCHDPHKNVYSKFLVVTNRYSELCMYCHQKDYWQSSSHNLSNATWNGSGSDPWFHTPYSTVSENGCENCHNPHSAANGEWLLNVSSEEENCLVCHNGNVAQKNIQIQLGKSYRHDVYLYSGIHDPNENSLVDTRHVECTDCHNPHAANSTQATAPNAAGPVQGVKGIDSNGNTIDPILYEYQVCYRCHADSPDKPGSPTTRQIEQNNVRLEFDPSNPSYHPIEAPGKNSNVPSLIAPMTESSVIYCTDCHASDGDASPAGPHGSIYPHILKYQYVTDDYTSESYENYRLCYECHDRSSVVSGGMGMQGRFYKRVHNKHIQRERTPCNVCHDPHGISSSQGNATNNAHLINFDVSVVSPDPRTGRLEYQDLGELSGRCYLQCHGVRHSPKSY